MKACKPLYDISKIYENLTSATPFSRGWKNLALGVPLIILLTDILNAHRMFAKLGNIW